MRVSRVIMRAEVRVGRAPVLFFEGMGAPLE